MAFLFLVMWIILSTTNGAYTTISGVWYDDFTGWTVSDGTNTMDDPVNTYTYKYHGPFTGDSNNLDHEQFSMTQSFYCAELSSVNVDYSIFFCGTEETDIVTLSLNDQQKSYTTLGTPQPNGFYDANFPACNNNYYYYYAMGPFTIQRVALNNLFTVQFDITVNNFNDYVMFRNIAIECVPITHPTTSPPTTPAPTTLTASPTYSPTHEPSNNPSTSPTKYPSNNPSNSPTHFPSNNPSTSPTYYPSNAPTNYPTLFPSTSPTHSPTLPTNMPSISPTQPPSTSPTKHPTHYPTKSPTNNPSTSPTKYPTNNPTVSPSMYPSNEPTNYPTLFPSTPPTYSPTLPTNMPSISPTHPPSAQPSNEPSATPTLQPTVTKPKGVDAGSSDVSGEIIIIVSILVGLCCVAIVVSFYCAKYRGVNSKKNKLDNIHYVQLNELIDNGPQRIFGSAVKSVPFGNTAGGEKSLTMSVQKEGF